MKALFFSIDWSYNYWSYTLKFLRPEVYAMFPAWTSSTKEFKLTVSFITSCFGLLQRVPPSQAGGLWNEIPMHSLSKGKEGKMQLTSVGHQGPQWEICWKGLGTQPGRAQMPRAGWPWAYLLVVCLGWLFLTSCVIFEQVMPLMGCVSQSVWMSSLNREARGICKPESAHTLPFLRTLLGSPFCSGLKSSLYVKPSMALPPIQPLLLPFFHCIPARSYSCCP